MPSRRDFLKGVLGAGVALPWAACSGGSSQPSPSASSGAAPVAQQPRLGGGLRIGLNSDLTTMDPHLSTAAVDRQVYQAIYDPLVRLQPDLSLAPGLAEKWEVSDDGANYTFYLRQGISFHDGERFDAKAVKYNFERMLTHPKSLRKGEVAEVEAVEVVGDYSVRLRLKQPSSPLLAQLTDRAGMMISPRAAEAEGEDFARRPVGTGPFRFVEWVKDDHLTVRKSPEYWEQTDDGALPYLDEVTYRPVPDVNVQLTSLRTGALDLVDRIPPKDIAALKQGKDPLLSEVPALAFEYLDMNHARPPFDQLNNRLSLLWAIAREPLLRAVFFGSGTPAHGPIPPLSWAYRQDFQPFTRDLARARQLAPNGFSFTAIVANTPVRKQTAEVFQQQLAEAGITMNIELLEFGTLLARRTAKDFQAVVLEWSGRPDPDGNIYAYYSSKGGQNFSTYANPQMDALLDQARAVSDQRERAQLYAAAEQLAAEDGRMFCLRFPMDQKLMATKVNGFVHIADGMIRPAAMWLG